MSAMTSTTMATTTTTTTMTMTPTTPMTTFTKTTKTKQEPIFKAASMKKSPTGPGSKMNQFVWRVNCLHLFQTSWLQSKSSRAISRLSQIKSLKWPFRPYLEHRELWTNSPALKLTNGFRLRPLCEGLSEKNIKHTFNYRTKYSCMSMLTNILVVLRLYFSALNGFSQPIYTEKY